MWRPFDWPDALTIENAFRATPFWEEPREVDCPIDRVPTVRSYYQHLSAAKSARYRWCPVCHRYSGQTVALPPPPDFADPVAAGSSQSLPNLLDELDGRWSAGELPQAFLP
jgi:hypothetical protein